MPCLPGIFNNEVLPPMITERPLPADTSQHKEADLPSPLDVSTRGATLRALFQGTGARYGYPDSYSASSFESTVEYNLPNLSKTKSGWDVVLRVAGQMPKDSLPLLGAHLSFVNNALPIDGVSQMQALDNALGSMDQGIRMSFLEFMEQMPSGARSASIEDTITGYGAAWQECRGIWLGKPLDTMLHKGAITNPEQLPLAARDLREMYHMTQTPYSPHVLDHMNNLVNTDAIKMVGGWGKLKAVLDKDMPSTAPRDPAEAKHGHYTPEEMVLHESRGCFIGGLLPTLAAKGLVNEGNLSAYANAAEKTAELMGASYLFGHFYGTTTMAYMGVLKSPEDMARFNRAAESVKADGPATFNAFKNYIGTLVGLTYAKPYHAGEPEYARVPDYVKDVSDIERHAASFRQAMAALKTDEEKALCTSVLFALAKTGQAEDPQQLSAHMQGFSAAFASRKAAMERANLKREADMKIRPDAPEYYFGTPVDVRKELMESVFSVWPKMIEQGTLKSSSDWYRF